MDSLFNLCSFSSGGGIFRIDLSSRRVWPLVNKSIKAHEAAVITTFCMSAQYHLISPSWPDMAPTWPPIGPQLRPILDPLGPTWHHAARMSARAGQIRNPEYTGEVISMFFCGMTLRRWAMLPAMCVSAGPSLVWSYRQRVSNQINFCSTSAPPDPLAPTWARSNVARKQYEVAQIKPDLQHAETELDSGFAQVEANWFRTAKSAKFYPTRLPKVRFFPLCLDAGGTRREAARIRATTSLPQCLFCKCLVDARWMKTNPKHWTWCNLYCGNI